MIIVAADGSGDFTHIQDAINHVSHTNTQPITIFIKAGTYKEKVHLTTPFITLKGEDAARTKLTFDDYALKRHSDGKKYGTFRSYTLFIGTHDVTIENLTIENSSGLGSQVGQALAVYADGDRLFFHHCRLLGHQDTLFTGPLPPAPIQPGSFIGPKENDARINGRQYYEYCYIEGEVDFIFGSATAFFYNCEIFSINLHKETNGYVTAPSTPSGQPYGYVFENCRLSSDCAPHTVYLGRPWRDYGQSVFIRCTLDAHIKKEGFHNWDKALAEKVSFFAECDCIGEGADTSERAAFAHQLKKSECHKYTREAVLNGPDHWMPWV